LKAVILALAAFTFTGTVFEAFADGPKPGEYALTSAGQMQIRPGDRCPVCGMRVADYPKFSCALQLTDGTTYYFCSSGCLLRTWLHPEIFLNADPSRRQRTIVRDYFSGRQIDGRAVFWVTGSDVIGPMGPAPVPLEGEKALKAFRRRHGGLHVFLLEDLDEAKWTAVTGGKPSP
jgi:nitrous oxide reductase accessory protein NosL